MSGGNGSLLFYYLYKKNMIKNVLPFFLDGGILSIDTDDGGIQAWNGKSSFVEITGQDDITFTVGNTDIHGKPVKHGVMLVITKLTEDGAVTVNPTSDFSSQDETIELSAEKDSVLLLFKGPSASNKYGEWVVLSKFQADLEALNLSNYALLTGADFTGDVTVSGNVGFNGAVAQGKATFVENAAGTDAAKIDAIRDVLVSYGMMEAS